jgi:ribosomal protein S18 acetylase RimI-like enzyme
VTYRAARSDDIAGIAEVHRAAYNALSRRHGFPELPAGPPNPFFTFSVQEEPEGCWVAEDGATIVGFAISWLRSDFWFLACLFIAPSLQGQSVGRALIERALAHPGHAANRALITLAYNPVSIGLYVRYAMYPREPLYLLEGPAEALRHREQPAEGLTYERLPPEARNADVLGRLDHAVLGHDRTRHHRFFLGAPGSSCYLFKLAGAPSGYAYVWPTGRVGPLVTLSPTSFEGVMRTALALASAPSTERVSVILAGTNERALAWAMRQGMRISLPLLLMATKPFGQLEAYGFYSPALM